MYMSFMNYQYMNPEFLNNYLKYCRFIEFYAASTVDEIYYDLRTYFRFIKLKQSDKTSLETISTEKFRLIEIKEITLNDIVNVTQQTIEDFIYFLRYTLENDFKARNRKLASIKKFYKYLNNNNMITYNPTLNIRSARTNKKIPKYLNLRESKTLLSKIISSEQKNKIRNYAIVCIFLNTGIRLSELVNIDLTDIKLDEMTIKIKGKGNKERILYLNEATLEIINEYLKVRPNLSRNNTDYKALFISSRNKRISKRAVQEIIIQELNLLFDKKENGYHTHTLRHSLATLLYDENNNDIMVIKKILGHKSLEATQVYTHVSDCKLKYTMENCTISSILENLKKEEDKK